MRTPDQIDASRTNGALSNGPVTPAGKFKAARNSLKHGLTAKSIVLPHESVDDFNILRDSYVKTFLPNNDPEWFLVEEMVACTWRIRRSWAFETAQIEIEAASLMKWISNPLLQNSPMHQFANAEKLHVKSLDQLRRHQERLSRQYYRAYKLLKHMQDSPERWPTNAILDPAPTTDMQNEPKPDPEITPELAFEPEVPIAGTEMFDNMQPPPCSEPEKEVLPAS